MDVPAKLQALCNGLRDHFDAKSFYVVDVEEEPKDRILFGMQGSSTTSLVAQMESRKIIKEATGVDVPVQVFTDGFDEVEYLFDRYLRAYIASHGGAVTPVRFDDATGTLWISMEGGCSGCPSSIATLKHGIEKTLRDHLPWLKRVEATNEPAEPDFGIHLKLPIGAAKSAK